MSYVKRRKSSFLVYFKNLPKLRTRARHEIRRKVYGTLLLLGATYTVVLVVNFYMVNKGGF